MSNQNHCYIYWKYKNQLKKYEVIDSPNDSSEKIIKGLKLYGKDWTVTMVKNIVSCIYFSDFDQVKNYLTNVVCEKMQHLVDELNELSKLTEDSVELHDSDNPDFPPMWDYLQNNETNE